MRLGNILLIAAVIACGFGAGYLARHRQFSIPASNSPGSPQLAGGDVQAGFDPSLILPPPSNKGVMLDPTLDMIREHYQAPQRGPTVKDHKNPVWPPSEAELRPVSNDVAAPATIEAPESNSLPPLSQADTPPGVVLPPVEAALPVTIPAPLPPPIIRLPAPPEEPAPTIKRVSHHQPAMWMYVKSRDLSLNFDVTRSGSSGIKAVELWGRRSSDASYECVDQMSGDKPPFATRLGSEGNYEFRLVLVSGTGVKSDLPARGELPDLYVCLDTTPPTVEMLSPVADPAEPGVVRIRWRADDKHLDENPIRLEYSVNGDSWLPIADEWLPNSGDFGWKVPEGLPSELHLRVSARDKAGNIGASRSPNKVPVDLTVPEGRISGVVETLPAPKEAIVELSSSPPSGIRPASYKKRSDNVSSAAVTEIQPPDRELLPEPQTPPGDPEQSNRANCPDAPLTP